MNVTLGLAQQPLSEAPNASPSIQHNRSIAALHRNAAGIAAVPHVGWPGARETASNSPKCNFQLYPPKSLAERYQSSSLIFAALSIRDRPPTPNRGDPAQVGGGVGERSGEKMTALGRQRNQVPVRLKNYPAEVITGPAIALQFD